MSERRERERKGRKCEGGSEGGTEYDYYFISVNINSSQVMKA